MILQLSFDSAYRNLLQCSAQIKSNQNKYVVTLKKVIDEKKVTYAIMHLQVVYCIGENPVEHISGNDPPPSLYLNGVTLHSYCLHRLISDRDKYRSFAPLCCWKNTSIKHFFKNKCKTNMTCKCLLDIDIR